MVVKLFFQQERANIFRNERKSFFGMLYRLREFERLCLYREHGVKASRIGHAAIYRTAYRNERYIRIRKPFTDSVYHLTAQALAVESALSRDNEIAILYKLVKAAHVKHGKDTACELTAEERDNTCAHSACGTSALNR